VKHIIFSLFLVFLTACTAQNPDCGSSQCNQSNIDCVCAKIASERDCTANPDCAWTRVRPNNFYCMLNFCTNFNESQCSLRNRCIWLFDKFGGSEYCEDKRYLDPVRHALLNLSDVGGPCFTNNDCTLPMDYAIRSNCPFQSLCIDARCSIVCPFAYHDADPGVSVGYPVACSSDSDCDCSNRGKSTLSCICFENKCFSVEKV
jgi:hypothetical protein